MSGLFVTSLTPRQLSYYFRDISSGKEDHRDGLSQNDISTFGQWDGLKSEGKRIDEIFEYFHALRSNPRFMRRLSNVSYDLTFVAPKQISILFGLIDNDTSERILESHKRAVTVAFRSVEENVTWGCNRSLEAIGFLHKTSRELDPHLHTHLLVANCVDWDNGKLRAIDSTSLYSSVGPISELYRLELAREIYRTTGIMTIDRDISDTNGPTEVPGFDPELVKLFSKRSQQVKSLTDKWGIQSPGASRTAALVSRREKLVIADDDLKQHWREQVEKASFTNDLKESIKIRPSLRRNGIFTVADNNDTKTNYEDLRMRWIRPSRAQGWLRFVAYEDDLFERFRSFSLGKVVAVIHGDKEIGKLLGDRDRYCEAIWDPLEVVVLGNLNLDKLAEVTDRYRHQNLVVAVQADSTALRDLEIEFSSANELSGVGYYLGSKLKEFGCDPAGQLKSCMESFSKIMRQQRLCEGSMGALVFATRRDRDLARKFIADSIGVEMRNSGFYDGEVVNIYYLPKGYAIEKSQTGIVNLSRDSIDYVFNGGCKSVPLSVIKPNAMVAPAMIKSQSNFLRDNREGRDIVLGIGEFAVVDRDGLVSLYAQRRGLSPFEKAVKDNPEVLRELQEGSARDHTPYMKRSPGLFREW